MSPFSVSSFDSNQWPFQEFWTSSLHTLGGKNLFLHTVSAGNYALKITESQTWLLPIY